ncbi:hypothetical protein TNCV_3758281 [Trichonephila clavipes]|nr:hypothetical protein TNCV_3758281 [Trichonephila clavipes]
MCRFLEKYGIGQSYQAGRTEDSNRKLWYTTKCLPEILQEVNEEEINVGINAFCASITRNKGFEALNLRKFVYKSALILEETTLNTPKSL